MSLQVSKTPKLLKLNSGLVEHHAKWVRLEACASHNVRSGFLFCAPMGERATSLIFSDDASNGPQVVLIGGFGASK